jgi:hypothetical protein
MRWLLIGFFASLGALLLAAAGLVRHIWIQRAKIRSMPPVGTRKDIDPALGPRKRRM